MGDLLEQAGLSTSGIDLEAAARNGRADFEGRTGRKMLATSQSRVYDPAATQDGVLVVGDWARVDSITWDGAGLVQGEDFRLEPLNAQADPEDLRPYTSIRFSRPLRFTAPRPSSLVLTIAGLYGYGEVIPDDAWEAMRRLGALSVMDTAQASAAGNQTGIPTSWKEDQSSESYGSGSSDPLTKLRSEGEGLAGAALSRYQEVIL